MNELAILFIAQPDGRPVVDSRIVAERFGKQHGHVLRDIDGLLEQAPGCLSNFGGGYYTLPATGARRHRLFLMDRDGFTLLAMGFTGPEALQWKLKFIEAFNQLEAKANEALTPAQVLLRRVQLMVEVETRLTRVEAVVDDVERLREDLRRVDNFRAASLPATARPTVFLQPQDAVSKFNALLPRSQVKLPYDESIAEYLREAYRAARADSGALPGDMYLVRFGRMRARYPEGWAIGQLWDLYYRRYGG